MIFNWTFEKNVLKIWNEDLTMGAELAPVGAPWRFMSEDWNVPGEAERPMLRITFDGKTYIYEDELGTALFALMLDPERGKYSKGTVNVKKGSAKGLVVHTIAMPEHQLLVLTSNVASKLDLIKFFRTIVPGFGLKEAKDLADQTCNGLTKIPEEHYRHIGIERFADLLRHAPLPIEFQIKEVTK